MRLGVVRFWAALGAGLLSHADIEVNVPFQVVRPSPNHSSMVPVLDSLARLAQHEGRIAVVSVVGPYHSGKSFLLNALLGNTQVFPVGRRTTPETMGIWLCRTNLQAQDGSEVWLVDSEGFFGPGVDESYDAKIFTVASLVGGHLVYNTVKIIDQQAVNLLEMLARRAQLFRTRSSAEDDQEAPEFLSVRSFPPLTWVVEDFVQELPPQHRHVDGATAWLKSYLAKVNNSEGTKSSSDDHILSKLYSDLKVHTLFLPATKQSQLQDLSQVSWEQLTPEFQSEIASLRARILGRLEARRFEGSPMTGKTLARSLRFIVQALQRGMFHELPSLWATWTTQVADMSMRDSVSWFASLLSGIDAMEDPIPIRDFNAEVEAARERSARFYTELLRDFDVSPDLAGLRKRLDTHFQQKLMAYHERIHRWVSELILEAKENFAKLLASFELPIDPDVIKKRGESASKTALAAFSSSIGAFAQRGARVSHGKAAEMPAFTVDPVAQLTNDLRSLQGNRELENEREILQFFKHAVAAADEAVDSELKVNSNRILGSGRMKDLQNVVSSKCWQAFDERLAKAKWMMLLPHYKTHKALVQTESFESRMARFAAANEQRLTAHFRTTLERCISTYKARKANLAMPASENDLDAEHRQLSSSIRELLEERDKDLADTEAFKASLRSLLNILEDGHRHARQKNIELWKVHSDEATLCAKRANQALERQCGLFCFFNKVPQVHKSTSQKHLASCMPRSGAGARMSPSMQLQVFENWYTKDLAHDNAAVWFNFYIVSALVGLGMLLFCGVCLRPQQSGVPYQYQVSSPTYGGGDYVGTGRW
mmetsp:Transcript_22775/g.50340  ORF Transcript_22775/g.50340 Transcript_22775/m.50340 type:complete len:825 (+) Transcript_22775:72-2546(+)